MSFSFAGQYGAEQVITPSGVPAADTLVNVYQHGTQTPVTLWTDRTKATVAANPVSTDQYGNLLFYTDPGIYDLVANGATVTIHVDPDAADVGTGGGGAVDSVNGQTGVVVLTAADVGADPAGSASTAQTAAEAASDPAGTATSTVATHTADTTAVHGIADTSVLEVTSRKDQPSGYAGLDGTGKLATSAIPSLALSETFVVASQAAMLALTAQTGDVAVRTDVSQTFILGGTGNPATLANWIQLATPPDAVTSVNGLTGAVSIPSDPAVGTAGLRTLGTGAQQAAPGNDSRITGAAQKASNLSDLSSTATARTNLGLGSAATQASTAFDAAGAATTAQSAAIAASAQRASNLSDLANVGTARTNLALLASGTLIPGRPAAASAPSQYYLATDDRGGTLYWSDGTAWTQVAASGNQASGAVLGYVELAADFNSTTSTDTDITGMSLTVTVGSRPIRIDVDGQIGVTGTAQTPFVKLMEDGALLGAVGVGMAVSNTNPVVHGSRDRSPSAGAHTYKLVMPGTASGVTWKAMHEIAAFGIPPFILRITEV